MAQRFSGDSRKFSGIEDLHSFITEYQYAARDFGLINQEKMQFLYLIIHSDALTYYQSNIKDVIHAFGAAVSMLDRHFNPLARQNQFYRFLRNLHIDDHTSSSLSSSLEKINSLITKHVPRIPRHKRGEEKKIEILRSAVAGCCWAHNVLIHAANHDTSYQGLLSKLQRAIQTDEEARLDRSRSQSSTPGTYFTRGQPMYSKSLPYSSRHPSHYPPRINFGARPSQNHSRPTHPHRSPPECWNCRGPHRFSDCTKPKKLSKIAANKLRYYAQKYSNQPNQSLKRILFEIVEQFDEPSNPLSESDHPDLDPTSTNIQYEDVPSEDCPSPLDDMLNPDTTYPIDDERGIQDILLALSSSSIAHPESPSLKDALEDF